MVFVGFHLERTLFFPSPVWFQLRIKDTGERQMEITVITSRADWESKLGFWPILHPNSRQS